MPFAEGVGLLSAPLSRPKGGQDLPLFLVRLMSRTDVFVYACWWLMALLVIGTVAQREIGLHAAQARYFSSWVLTVWGFVPLPGGRLTMLVVFMGLTLFLVRRFSLRPRKLGITIVHSGGLLLLIGGFVTAYFASEGSMAIGEGESASFVTDYHKRELVLVNSGPEGHDSVTAFGESLLRPGGVLSAPDLSWQVEILHAFENCRFVERSEDPPQDARGLYQRLDLVEEPSAAEDEQNLRGLLYRVLGTAEEDGVYALVERQKVSPEIGSEENARKLIFRRARRYLPFSIELDDFEKRLHPGTGMAQSYQSVVYVVDGETRRRVVISMNEPLRYRGHTFYQSSFIEGAAGDTTILAVVRNAGRMMPYIASVVMCVGLLLHLLAQVPRLARKKEGEA